MSRVLARLGAEVVGVDVSSALLERGRAAEAGEPLGVRYVEVDVASEGALAGERFEVVTCHFGLSDIDDLEGVLGTVARVLAPGGVFVFSILHPCFPGWGEDAPSAWRPGGGYYLEGWWLAENPGFRGQVGSNFRMLSTYLNALVRHGLSIEGVAEPDPGPEWAARVPGADAVPVYLVVGCRRASEGASAAERVAG
jgi:SAM-dependent methyltransferase